MRSFIRAVGVFAAVVAGACGSADEGDGCLTALCLTGGPTAPTSATNPTDGGGGDETTAGGVEPPTCDGCRDDQVCIQGACTDVPTMCPCPVETYCDLGLGQCKIGCTKDAECDDYRICDVPTRTCEPGCRSDAGCPAGQVCDGEMCRKGCFKDADCPLEQLCDEAENSCYAGCDSLDNCGEGKICKDAVCQVGCVDNSWCGDGEVCKNDECVAGCASSDECGAGTICVDNKCVEGCDASDQCPLGTYCSGTDCVEGCGAPGGAKNSGDPKRCQIGEGCTGRECDGNNQNCAKFVCDDDCLGTCHATPEEPYVCFPDAAKTKAFCMLLCDSDSDCEAGELCLLHANPPEAPNYTKIKLCRKQCDYHDDCENMHSDFGIANCECYNNHHCYVEFQGQMSECVYREPLESF